MKEASQHQQTNPYTMALSLSTCYLFAPLFDDDGGEPTVQVNSSSPVLPTASVALTVTVWVVLLSLS